MLFKKQVCEAIEKGVASFYKGCEVVVKVKFVQQKRWPQVLPLLHQRFLTRCCQCSKMKAMNIGVIE